MDDPTDGGDPPQRIPGPLVRVDLPSHELAESISAELTDLAVRIRRHEIDLLRRLGVQTNLDNREEYWYQMRAAARYVGLSNEEFWNSDPRELCALLEFKAREFELLAGVRASVTGDRPDAAPTPMNTAEAQGQKADVPTSLRGRKRRKPNPECLPLNGSVSKRLAAKALGCSVKTIERMVLDGRIHKARSVKGMRFGVDEIRRILDSRGVRQTPKK